ncbi:PSPA7_2676 family Cys-rich small protein [Pseudomonas nitroreducens]|uniref:PSPA7_2676 family Cys-rich small protein n=1 Tax=Pseudomonas nitroreducens TaxID=46680 RepID=UPI003B97B3AB
MKAIGRFRLPILERSREPLGRLHTRTSREPHLHLSACLNTGVAGGGHMRLRCFFLGCAWDEGNLTEVGHVPMLCQRCARCGAQRYLRPAPEI